jgi:acetolactate synthase-1/3 small subunit
MTGAASKIEGLIQVLRESGYTILEVSRTGRMAMRRGKHTSRVLKALGTNDPAKTAPDEIAADLISSEFDDN